MDLELLSLSKVLDAVVKWSIVSASAGSLRLILCGGRYTDSGGNMCCCHLSSLVLNTDVVRLFRKFLAVEESRACLCPFMNLESPTGPTDPIVSTLFSPTAGVWGETCTRDCQPLLSTPVCVTQGFHGASSGLSQLGGVEKKVHTYIHAYATQQYAIFRPGRKSRQAERASADGAT